MKSEMFQDTEINFHNLDNKVLQDMEKNCVIMKYFNGAHVIKEHESPFFNTKQAFKDSKIGFATEIDFRDLKRGHLDTETTRPRMPRLGFPY